MAPCADKIASRLQVLGEHDNNVKGMLNEFGVALKPSSFKKDVRPLLKEACTAILAIKVSRTALPSRDPPVHMRLRCTVYRHGCP